MDDAAVLDVLASSGNPSSSAMSESAASPMVAATSIGTLNLLVSSHTSARSRDTNCGVVSEVNWAASMQLNFKAT